jgi:hypothetical protein
MAGAKKASRKGMKLSEEAQAKKDKKTKVTFVVENPLRVEYNETSIIFCSLLLDGTRITSVVYCEVRGSDRILNLASEYNAKSIVLEVIKNTGTCIID